MSEVEKLLASARVGLNRVLPMQLSDEVAHGALVVDIRPEADRTADGLMPGALIIERNVLEWRLDPTSPDRIAEADATDRRIILFCNEGYASSFAAVSLRSLGLSRATDLDGGYRAWRREVG